MTTERSIRANDLLDGKGRPYLRDSVSEYSLIIILKAGCESAPETRIDMIRV